MVRFRVRVRVRVRAGVKVRVRVRAGVRVRVRAGLRVRVRVRLRLRVGVRGWDWGRLTSQMKGNAMPGGVHHGRIVSAGVGTRLPSTSKPPRGGRFAGSGEKRRERSERKAKSGGTNGAGS